MSLLLEWWSWLRASPTPPPLPLGNELNAEVCTVIWFPSGCALKEQVCVERNCFVGFPFIQVLPPAWITWVDSIKAWMDAVHWRAFLEHVPFLQWCIINQLQASLQAKVAFKDAVSLSSFLPILFLSEESAGPIWFAQSLVWPHTFQQWLLWTTLSSGCKVHVYVTTDTEWKNAKVWWAQAQISAAPNLL